MGREVDGERFSRDWGFEEAVQLPSKLVEVRF